MSNRSKDNIEDLFRRIFRKEKKGRKGTGWDVPPDEVWAQIEQELVKTKKSEQPYLYWRWLGVGTCLLLLLSLTQLYLSNQKMQVLSNRLERSEESLKHIQQEINDLKNGQVSKKKDPEQSIFITSPPKKSKFDSIQEANEEAQKIIENHSLVVSPNKTRTSPKKPNQTKDQFSVSISTSPLNLTKQTTIPSGKAAVFNNISIEDSFNKSLGVPLVQTQVITHSHSEQSMALAVPTLVVNPSEIFSNTRHKDSIDLLIAPIQSVVKKKPSFYVATMYAPIWSTNQIKGIPTRRSSLLPNREVQVSAFTTGLDMGFVLPNNWTIESGVRFTSINKQVRHTRNFLYFDLKERLAANGNFESDLNLSLIHI